MGIDFALGSSAWLPAGLGFRNLVMNGAMQISQRGTSTASITADGYNTADRWKTDATTLGTWTQSVENDAPTGSEFRKSLKMLCTTADASPAAGDRLAIVQSFEGQNVQSIKKGTSSASQLLLTFWVKSNVTGTYVVELFDVDNTRQVSASYTVLVSATWEKKTIVLPPDATGVFDNDANGSLDIRFWLGVGSTYSSGTLNTSWNSNTSANRAVGQTNLAAATSNYWQITGVQLEQNLQPTPFEQRPIGVELALCQRYYQMWRGSASTGYNFSGVGIGYNSTSAYPVVRFQVQMRTPPTVIDFNNMRIEDTTADFTVTSLTIESSTIDNVRLAAIVASGSVQYRIYNLSTRNLTTSYMGIGAEL